MAWLLDKLTRQAALRLGPVSDSLYRRAKRFTREYENFNYDPETNGEFALLRALRRASPRVVFDVGANIGSWSVAAARALPQASIHAFEVVPETAKTLAATVSDLSNVTVVACGLSDRAGQATALVDASASWLSSIAPGVTEIHRGNFTPVACNVTTGDAYSMRAGVGCINLLKLDVEGSEGAALDGFRSMLSSGAIDIVQFEYGMQNIYTRFLLMDFYRVLGGDYEIGKLLPSGVRFKSYDPEDEDLRGPNFVAVRRQHPDLIALLREF